MAGKEVLTKQLKKRQEFYTKALVFIIAIVLFIFLTPQSRSDIGRKPDEIKVSEIIPKTDQDELLLLAQCLDSLNKEGYHLVQNNYPNSVTVRWTGDPLMIEASGKAEELAKRVCDKTGRSVRIVLESGGVKTSGYFRP
jgi:hypothetical protein